MEKLEYWTVLFWLDDTTNKWHTRNSEGDDETVETNLGQALDSFGEQGWEAVGFAPTVLVMSAWAGPISQQWSVDQYRVLLKRR